MANNPIGITFLPSEDNAQMGPKRGALEGDLGQAFKILSLRLPRVQGARAIAPPSLMNSPGAAGVGGGGGFNPQAAIFQALLQAMGGGAPAPMGGGMAGGGMPMGSAPPPQIIPGSPAAAPPQRFEPTVAPIDRTSPMGGNRGSTASPVFRAPRGGFQREM